jgi:hypothetical protein
MASMFANNEVASRHLPCAHGRDEKVESARDSQHPESNRLQAAVVADRERDDVDPYADVPCTD